MWVFITTSILGKKSRENNAIASIIGYHEKISAEKKPRKKMAEEKRPKEKMADGKKSPKEKKAPFPLDALFFLLLNTHPSIP